MEPVSDPRLLAFAFFFASFAFLANFAGALPLSAVTVALDCPLPQIGQNTTNVSAFLYADGQPYANASLELEYAINGSEFITFPLSVDPATGKHDFIIDTRKGGDYLVRANSNNSVSNNCTLLIFEEKSMAVPEMPELLLLLAAAAAFVWAGRPGRQAWRPSGAGRAGTAFGKMKSGKAKRG